MPGTKSTDHDASRRTEVERLLALALDMLDRDREQIVRDYLEHTIAALGRIRQSEPAGDPSGVPE